MCIHIFVCVCCSNYEQKCDLLKRTNQYIFVKNTSGNMKQKYALINAMMTDYIKKIKIIYIKADAIESR